MRVCNPPRPNFADRNLDLVLEILQHPIHVRLYSTAPYLAELYRSDLASRIQTSLNSDRRDFSRPLAIRKGKKNYFIPGSSQDLIFHAVCAAAFYKPFFESFSAEEIETDYCPPLWREIQKNSCGDSQVMLAYWQQLNAETGRRMQRDFSHVLHADISDCYASVDTGALSNLIRDLGADSALANGFQSIHEYWAQAGCRGLPLTGSSYLPLKFYLKQVDDHLKSAGVPFIRLQDDFRIFGHTECELQSHQAELEKALQLRGMRINPKKTQIVSHENQPPITTRFSPRDWRRTFSQGILLPLLSDSLRLGLLRPASLRLLRWCYGHTCWPS